MIRIKRAMPAPATMNSEKVRTITTAIELIARDRKPLSKEFVAYWGEDDVREALWRMQHHKCCYCERKREKNRESDIEHFRPKADVTEAAADHKGYWWLAYKWENLFFSCRYCNQENKKNHFPIPHEERRAKTSRCCLNDEDAYLVDPTTKNPEEHIGFDWFEKATTKGEQAIHAIAVGRTEYGTRTIEVVGLNKFELPLERGQLVIELEALAILMEAASYHLGVRSKEEVAVDIRKATSSKMPFAGFRRDFFCKNRLDKFVATD